MTIRRNVNIAAINSTYGQFLDGVETAKAGVVPIAQNVADMIGDAVDGILREARVLGLEACNCDGIREIEVMIFDMLLRKNPNSQITAAIEIGSQSPAPSLDRQIEIVNRVTAERQMEEDAEADYEARNGAALVVSGFDDFRRQGGEFGQ